MLGLTVIDMIPETNIKKIHGKHICKCQMNTPEQLLYAKNKKKIMWDLPYMLYQRNVRLIKI
jgi:hypothetical protein